MAVPARRDPRRWDPFRDFEELYDRLGRWFEEGTGEARTWAPSVDIEETDLAYKVDAELPGVQKDDITVEYRDGILQIAGESKEKERVGIVHRRTRRTGRFSYQVTVPTEVDASKIDASLSDGVLTVTLPKSETKKSVRKIEVRG
ncbi:Hsp20/alpha crystallin family protein [Hoyosella altamirensis]|uniref:HSP20 family protein n=1 Tax=Hoyosella altamirensis TaxID=616997 RepID=A0A839RJB7_9ACTN|nr:Hsp20/alpha crystallin family protein [Hoyosella altamirensis]MBB3036328.1 HSP20 family protein [Hoyosella altamirensis]